MEAPFHETVAASNMVPWRHMERGPVRLVVELPVRTGRLVLAYASLYAVTVVLLLFVAALWRLLIGETVLSSSDSGFLVAMILMAGVPILVNLFLARVGASRETLEVDSRFVSLARQGQVVGLWGRALAGAFVPWTPPTEPWRIWVTRHFLNRPTIAWGSAEYPGWTGSGISGATAISLLQIINDFCRDNPPEPGFEYHLGSIPMEDTANKRFQRAADMLSNEGGAAVRR
jgi:hypothetical protein